jgi:hypothetical protein
VSRLDHPKPRRATQACWRATTEWRTSGRVETALANAATSGARMASATSSPSSSIVRWQKSRSAAATAAATAAGSATGTRALTTARVAAR